VAAVVIGETAGAVELAEAAAVFVGLAVIGTRAAKVGTVVIEARPAAAG